MKHSELPWTIMYQAAFTLIYGPNGERVCRMIDNKKCDTPFIVRACNNHYKLLEAVRGLVSRLEHLKGTTAVYESVLEQRIISAKKAIKEATP